MDQDTTRLLAVAERLLGEARHAGSDAADVAVANAFSRSVDVRLGHVEETGSSETESVSLRVFVGDRVASVSGDTRSDLKMLAERAVAMAKVSPPDRFASLADEARLAKEVLDLDQFDPTDVATESLRETALALEDAARSVPGVTNSNGASASAIVGGRPVEPRSGHLPRLSRPSLSLGFFTLGQRRRRRGHGHAARL